MQHILDICDKDNANYLTGNIKVWDLGEKELVQNSLLLLQGTLL